MYQNPIPWFAGLAHQGHGHGAAVDGETLWHYLTEPEHWPLVLATTVAVLMMTVFMAWLLIRVWSHRQSGGLVGSKVVQPVISSQQKIPKPTRISE